MMRSWRFTRLTLLAILAVVVTPELPAQIITTVAGGGPNNVPALSANLALPRAVVVDASGNLFIAAERASYIYKVDTSGVLTVVAGTGGASFSGDGGPATSAGLSFPYSVALDAAGNMFIADFGNQRIRRVDAATGIISTVAGDGTFGFSGDGGPATNASLANPVSVAVDVNGNLFIADFSNSRVRRVDAATGIISTVAGNGNFGFSGDGGPAINARLFGPWGIALDAFGNLYFADRNNNRIRRVDVVTGIISTFAGSSAFGGTGDGGPATSASIARPVGVGFDAAGNLFIAEFDRRLIRRVDAATGIISTVAGNQGTGFSGDGGPAIAASLSDPYDVAIDASGNLFIADSGNFRIRRVRGDTGIISTVVGNGAFGFSGDGGPASRASLTDASGLALDAAGTLFIADTGNKRIRRVDAASKLISTAAGTGVRGFSGDGGPATSARVANVAGMDVDDIGNLVFADVDNNRIRRVDAVSGIISTVAGSQFRGFSGDGGPATSAHLNRPTDVALNANGDMFIAGFLNNRIRRVDVATGIISTVAGNGLRGFSGDGGLATSARLNRPRGLALDAAGNLFISDTDNNRIRRVDFSTGIISTVAGNGALGFSGDGGPATEASLNKPTDVTLDAAGNMLIADRLNHRIRRVDASTGVISTMAGNGLWGFSGDGGLATDARLAAPIRIIVDPEGSIIFFVDFSNRRVRRVSLNPRPPVALCRDITVSAGENTCDAFASVDGGSFDPDGDAITAVQNPSGPYIPGTVLVTLTVQDDAGATDTCQATVTVLDTTPPDINISLEPMLLWPPNHRLVNIEATVTAVDACGPSTVQLTSIASNEADDESGDGSTIGDIQAALLGSADFDFALRAERVGDGNGRVYTVVYTATDESGNQAGMSSRVVVPHDQKGVVEPVILAVQEQTEGTHLNWTPVPGALFYNVISGRISAIRDSGSSFDLGATSCIEAASEDASTTGNEDSSQPLPGEAVFYLVEYYDGWITGYGTDSAVKPRSFTGGCPRLSN